MKNLLLMRRMYKLRVCPEPLAMQLATTLNNCNLQKQSPKTFAHIIILTKTTETTETTATTAI